MCSRVSYKKKISVFNDRVPKIWFSYFLSSSVLLPLSLSPSLSLSPFLTLAALSPALCVNVVNVHSIIESLCACSRIQILGGSFG